MAHWRKRYEKFSDVRELIEDGKSKEVMDVLYEICNEFADSDDSFAEDFETLAEDIDAEREDYDEGTVDFYLTEFYELCDNAGIWLGIKK